MTNDLPASEQLDVSGESQRTKGVGQSNHGSGNFDKAGIQSELPPNIKAIQEFFRPRFEAQDRRMEALAAAEFAARLANATVTHDLPVEEALELLARSAAWQSESD